MRRSCALVLNMVFEKVKYIAIQLLGGRTAWLSVPRQRKPRDYVCCGAVVELLWRLEMEM